MKRLTLLIAAVLVAGASLVAHGDADHVRGTISAMSGTSITVQTTEKASTVLALTSKTTFTRGGKPARLADLKVGDRVVVDVPKGTKDAEEIQIGVSAAKPSK
jgi:uncharacterized protein DUF5666